MNTIKGLSINSSDESNIVFIDDNATFEKSSIKILGKNNSIIINESNIYRNLKIRLEGDGKSILIEPSKKNIVNLNIISHRGNNQIVNIGKNLSCGGLTLYLNDGDESITIGDDCLFSWDIQMRTSDGHSLIDLLSGTAINMPRPIKIGNKVWIGQNVFILKGAEINDESVIALGSIVTKKFEETNIVLAGNPAKIVRKGIAWNRMMPSEFNSRLK